VQRGGVLNDRTAPARPVQHSQPPARASSSLMTPQTARQRVQGEGGGHPATLPAAQKPHRIGAAEVQHLAAHGRAVAGHVDRHSARAVASSSTPITRTTATGSRGLTHLQHGPPATRTEPRHSPPAAPGSSSQGSQQDQRSLPVDASSQGHRECSRAGHQPPGHQRPRSLQTRRISLRCGVLGAPCGHRDPDLRPPLRLPLTLIASVRRR
jgi:hypothetical protein